MEKKEATNMPVSEGLPFGEAFESNEVTKKKRRITKKPSVKFFLYFIITIILLLFIYLFNESIIDEGRETTTLVEENCLH
jgi:hypothetical protein